VPPPAASPACENPALNAAKGSTPMSRALLIAILAVALHGCDRQASPPPQEAASARTAATPKLPADALRALERYEEQARGYLVALDGEETVAELDAHAEELVATAAEVLPAFLDLKPHCRAYLETALALRERWQDLDAAAIEAGYHKDGALPAVDDAAACYHMKDLIVHPITARALLREAPDQRAPARREIEEVLAHIGVVRATR
jgi:hypothetical protein